jgi:hypothetical protein
MDKKVTVLITSYPEERRKNITKLLDFVSGEKYQIIVCDQSVNYWAEPPKCCEYVHYPITQYNLYEMFYDVIVRYVSSEYVFWNNDDDFVISEGLDRTCQFLESSDNLNYSYASGEVVKLDANGRVTAYGAHEWRKAAVSSDDASDRLVSGFRDILLNPHAIISREVWLKALGVVLESLKYSECSLAPIRFWDKILNFYALLLGKRVTNIDALMLVRTSHFGRLIEDRAVEYPDELERDVEFDEIFNRLRSFNPLARDLADCSDLTTEESHELIKTIFQQRRFRTSKRSIGLRKLPHQKEPGKRQLSAISATVRVYRRSAD